MLMIHNTSIHSTSIHSTSIHRSSHAARLLKAALVVLGAALFANLLGCGSSSIPISPTKITIQGSTATSVDPGDSVSFTATVMNDSNSAGVNWQLSGTGCTGAACGIFTNASNTGITYTAPATVTTPFTVTITVTSVVNPSLTTVIQLSIPVNPSVTTTAGALAGGVVGTPYSMALAGSGGISPYTWSITQGTLPAGLTLNATTGVISGMPTAGGNVSFTVTLADSGSPALTATAAYTLAVVYPALTIGTSSLPNGTYGTAYTAKLSASGGTGTGYTWTVTSGTGLSVAGLSLTPAGIIMGTPTTGENAAPVTVKVTDSFGDTASMTLALTVVYPAIVVTTTTLPSGTYGIPYAANLSATGGSGTPYTWTVVSGTGLSAAGLTLSTTGAISGTPTAEEIPGTVTVKVTDSYGDTATATITLTIGYPVLTIITVSLPSGLVGTPYSTSLAASGGSNTGYTWTVTSGATSLSSLGLTLSTTGVLSGSTPTSGTATFTVQVTDSTNNTATANLTVTVDSALVITTHTLANGTQGTPYSATLAANGGSGTGYTWTVTSGTGLSAVGLSLSSSGAISGIPTAGESSVPFTVQVKDANGNTASATLTLTVTSVVFQGQVLSGQRPVAGATIQLYTVGSTGNGSAATPMLTQTVITDGIGMFNLAGYYTCGQSSTGSAITGGSNQVYLVATGGSTSTSTSSTTGNPALIMVSAVGPCTSLGSTSGSMPFFTINELTTAAAAWALTPFSASATNIGATATNTLGITNAFLDAALLANSSTGTVATLPANLTIEAGKLNALADALNSCAASASGSTCGPLFTAATPAGGTAPADIFAAALNIVKNPGQNVAAVYATVPTTAPPFATTLIQAPNDWTMSLNVTGGGIAIPKALALDSLGNVWVANQAGPLSAFNPQGTPLSATGFGGTFSTEIAQVDSIAVDTSDNIWVTNYNGYQGGSGGYGTVTEFYGASSTQIGVSPQPTGYGGNLHYPDAIAADSNGNLFIADNAPASSTVFSGTGTLVSPDLGANQNLPLVPEAIALDQNHGFWLPGGFTVAHISAPSPSYPSGQLLSNATCCQLSKGLATDDLGNVWVADYLGGPPAPNNSGAFAEIASNGTVLLSSVVAGGINHPEMVAVDAAQNVWFTNFATASITEIAGHAGTLTPGTALSPTTGLYGVGGFGRDASLDAPVSVIPDRSGNLWVSNDSVDAVTMFFGLAAPTITPLRSVPTAP